MNTDNNNNNDDIYTLCYIDRDNKEPVYKTIEGLEKFFKDLRDINSYFGYLIKDSNGNIFKYSIKSLAFICEDKHLLQDVIKYNTLYNYVVVMLVAKSKEDLLTLDTHEIHSGRLTYDNSFDELDFSRKFGYNFLDTFRGINESIDFSLVSGCYVYINKKLELELHIEKLSIKIYDLYQDKFVTINQNKIVNFPNYDAYCDQINKSHFKQFSIKNKCIVAYKHSLMHINNLRHLQKTL